MTTIPTLDDIFIPLKDLKKLEPSYFTPAVYEKVEAEDGIEPINKTPTSLLEEGARKVYQRQPKYTTTEEYGEKNTIIFTTTLELAGMTSKGSGKTKKVAKHEACREILEQVVAKGRHREFGIPGATEEEAMRYVKAMVCDSAPKVVVADGKKGEGASVESKDYNPSENYIGKLQELCSKKKLSGLIYPEAEKSGPGHDFVFSQTCIVGNEEVVGEGKTKKTAKSLAAYKMYTLLMERFASMNNEDGLNDDIIDDGADDVVDAYDFSDVEDPEAKVDEILADSSKFTSSTKNFRLLERPCSFGLWQSLLTIECSPCNGEALKLVFPGVGVTEDASRISAGRAALVHFSTF